jgi:hypothetical protein
MIFHERIIGYCGTPFMTLLARCSFALPLPLRSAEGAEGCFWQLAAEYFARPELSAAFS